MQPRLCPAWNPGLQQNACIYLISYIYGLRQRGGFLVIRPNHHPIDLFADHFHYNGGNPRMILRFRALVVRIKTIIRKWLGFVVRAYNSSC